MTGGSRTSHASSRSCGARPRLLRDDRLPFLVAQLDTLIEAGDDPATADAGPDEGDAVQVLTYHKAKGLEFPVVFMAGLVEDRFPTRSRDRWPRSARRGRARRPSGLRTITLPRNGASSTSAMTRAREELILSWAADYGGRRTRRMSPFVLEALDLSPATPLECAPAGPAGAYRPPRAAGSRAGCSGPPRLDERPLSLSYGQVNDYLECPARYRFGHLIRIPTPPSHQLVYGRALHAAVQAFHRRQMAGATP